MVTSIYSLGKVVGAELMLAGVLLCVALYLTGCFLFRRNRTRRGAQNVVLALLGVEILCDAVWFLFYFPGGDYHNYGIGGVMGVFLWPMLLCLAGVVATAVNQPHEEE